MKKKKHYITHLILLFLVVIILFPVFWVVMTSLRRDNAAFSPKLFSTNLTLQHYKDLIFPPKNVPALISKLTNEIGVYSPYDKKSPEKLRSMTKSDLELFGSHLERSRQIQSVVLSLYENLEKNLKEKFPALMRKTADDFKRVSDSISRIDLTAFPKEKVDASIYIVLKEYKKKGDWYKALTQSGEEQLKASYEKIIGKKKARLHEIEQEVNQLRREIERAESEREALSRNLAEAERAIEIMGSDISKIVQTLKVAAELEGSGEFDTTEIASKIGLLISEMEPYAAFKDIVDALRECKAVLKEGQSLSNEGLKVFGEKTTVLESILQDMEYQFEKYKSAFEKALKVQAVIDEKKDKLKELESEMGKTRQSYESVVEGLRAVLRAVYRAYLSYEFEKKAKALENLKYTSASLTKLSIYYKALRRSVALAKDLEVESVKEIESAVDSLEWVADWKNLKKSVPKFVSSSDKLLKEMGSYYESLKKRWEKLLRLSLAGESLVPAELSKMRDTVSGFYEGNVSAPLGIAMRVSRALADKFPIKSLRRDLKKIDASLYAYQQIWKRKPKHYFLRWVMNSVIVAGLVALITTAVTAIAAYPFSRMRFFGRKYGIMVLLLIQMFPAIMYMVALYGMLAFLGKVIPWLGLDTLGGLIFVYLGGIAFNMFLIKGYYDTIPASLEESAMIDGATRFQTFWLIIVPLARPILAVVVILTFMGTFNEFVLARIILQDVKNYTYALGLWSFSVGPYETEWGLFTAAALLGMLPMVILFLSLQRFLISGLTKGSVKG